MDEAYEDGYSVSEYDLISSPNDFNVKTIFDLIISGVIEIPGFQRNYVWDIKRASRLIESIIVGIPIPQIFLYEKGRNQFLVIDGQQRLMTIYYFVKERFPKKEKRAELRRIFNQQGNIPEAMLADDQYFDDFKLSLSEKLPDQKNKLNKLGYGSLGEYQSSFDLRTIRCIVIKQVAPKGDTAIYEIFNRLNTGGMNLSQQEIRMSLYHSNFYDMLHQTNANPTWRRILGIPEPDIHMKDLESLLRGLALLIKGDEYRPSMVRFLNGFSRQAQNDPPEEVEYLGSLFGSFLESCSALPDDAFQTGGRFSLMLFESVFVAVCLPFYSNHHLVSGTIVPDSVAQLKADRGFKAASQKGTASKDNVQSRLQRAQELIRLASA
ncbi:MAG: DUF262 domain-containing protein [Chloroflexaceae bacterium]|nr:DUF262 domain-containing protein [Chloroflexaceae bacterium]